MININERFNKLNIDNPNDAILAINEWLENRTLYYLTDYQFNKLVDIKTLYENSTSELQKYEFLKKLYYFLGLSRSGKITKWVLWKFVLVQDGCVYFKTYKN